MSGGFDAQYTEYQLRRSWLRRQVRRAYLASAARKLRGPTLDFGCGVGELLARLPSGSLGVEYNPATVSFCRAQGLDVVAYDGFLDDWALSTLPAQRRFTSMVISHVLEHLEQPANVLARLLTAAARLGIRPEHLAISREKGDLPGRVSHVEKLGGETLVYVQVPEQGLLTA